MKRSQINQIMVDALAFLEEMHLKLPPFAYWSPAEFEGKISAQDDVVRANLGWDITDFGGGDFEKRGLFLFTLRNGVLGEQQLPEDKSYAEKILIVQPEQVTPMHYHFLKTEDIINRGGGELVLELHNRTEDNQLAETPVSVEVDGSMRTLKSGELLVLQPGSSVCLTPYLYHSFWAQKSPVLVGEVSSVNDDNTDNYFHEPLGRFPNIAEDEPPLHLLTTDYSKHISA